jgi:hypothetical protein
MRSNFGYSREISTDFEEIPICCHGSSNSIELHRVEAA